MRTLLAAVSCVVLLCGGVASAQWLRYPSAGLPRNPDGTPNLSAPAPKLPDDSVDLSGIWRVVRTPDGRWGVNIAADLPDVPMLPAAAKLYEERKVNDGRDHPRVRCLPRGIANSMMWTAGPFKIVHTPGVTFLLFEEFVTFRQVFTDGRSFPEDMQPAWWGYSIGRWEGDAFVIQSTGFKDNGWLDFNGHPYSEALKVTERFRRKDLGHMDIDFTFDDAKMYAKPWTATVGFELMPDTDFIEHVCENERSYEHMTGN